MKINVGKEFYHRLANRDKNQGDGKHTAIEFRQKYLNVLDNLEIWKDKNIAPIVLDFSDVKILGPSFANEAFAFFTQYSTPANIKEVILFENISRIHKLIIEQELETGYKGRIIKLDD